MMTSDMDKSGKYFFTTRFGSWVATFECPVNITIVSVEQFRWYCSEGRICFCCGNEHYLGEGGNDDTRDGETTYIKWV
jgi:hypothetical protein